MIAGKLAICAAVLILSVALSDAQPTGDRDGAGGDSTDTDGNKVVNWHKFICEISDGTSTVSKTCGCGEETTTTCGWGNAVTQTDATGTTYNFKFCSPSAGSTEATPGVLNAACSLVSGTGSPVTKACPSDSTCDVGPLTVTVGNNIFVAKFCSVRQPPPETSGDSDYDLCVPLTPPGKGTNKTPPPVEGTGKIPPPSEGTGKLPPLGEGTGKTPPSGKATTKPTPPGKGTGKTPPTVKATTKPLQPVKKP